MGKSLKSYFFTTIPWSLIPLTCVALTLRVVWKPLNWKPRPRCSFQRESTKKVWAPIGALNVAKHPSVASCFVPWRLALTVIVAVTRTLKWKIWWFGCLPAVSQVPQLVMLENLTSTTGCLWLRSGSPTSSSRGWWTWSTYLSLPTGPLIRAARPAHFISHWSK